MNNAKYTPADKKKDKAMNVQKEEQY